MAGKFYSIGIGLGGEYLTLSAKKALETADVIAVPANNGKSTALSLINGAADISGKRVITLDFPMGADKEKRVRSRLAAAETVAALLDGGKTTAMITLGDAAVYSTCSYVTHELQRRGYETETLSGVPSFCIAAAKAGISLCEGNETLAIVPAVEPDEKFEKILDTFDNIVIMKAGKNTDKIYDLLEKRGLLDNAVLTSDINMSGEFIGRISREKRGYFTTVIIKKGSHLCAYSQSV